MVGISNFVEILFFVGGIEEELLFNLFIICLWIFKSLVIVGGREVFGFFLVEIIICE